VTLIAEHEGEHWVGGTIIHSFHKRTILDASV
jgi:hypothetical protein